MKTDQFIKIKTMSNELNNFNSQSSEIDSFPARKMGELMSSLNLSISDISELLLSSDSYQDSDTMH